jgi:hypothetical protein
MTSIIPIAEIKKHAREAAERGDLPTACPYIAGSDAEYQWKTEFYYQVMDLNGEHCMRAIYSQPTTGRNQ